MTLNELIERLEEILSEVSGTTPIRGAFQPNYPLVADVAAVTTFISEDADESGVYIALADGRNYGSSAMWDDEVVYRDEEDADEDEDGTGILYDEDGNSEYEKAMGAPDDDEKEDADEDEDEDEK